MATFWKEIKNKYSVKTYQGTKNTYDWIVKALINANLNNDAVDVEFLFNVSGLLCNCKGIEEFIENAYNQEEYSLTNIQFYFCIEDKWNVSIGVKYDDRISISSSSKMILERIVKMLAETSLEGTDGSELVSVTYVQTQINNDGVIIKVDGNVVANNHSKVEVDKEEKESGLKTFLNGVFQNIASNFLWYLLTLAAGGLLTYFLAK